METKSVKNKLVVMIGIPGSGKSTYITSKMKHAHVVSRDAIRFSMVTDKDNYFSRENEVWTEFINQIKESLKKYYVTVADATHLNTRSRAKLFRALGSSLKDIEIVAVYVKAPIETCIERNNLREGLAVVPESAIRRMASQIEEPIVEEGWGAIIIYNSKEEYFERVKI